MWCKDRPSPCLKTETEKACILVNLRLILLPLIFEATGLLELNHLLKEAVVMRNVMVASICSLLVLTGTTATAQSGTDWTEGAITAIGIGVPPVNARTKGQGRAMARRAATVDAQRLLVEILQGVNVDAETTVENFMANDIVKTRVKGILRGARQVGKPTYMDDGSVEVTLAVNLRGTLSDVLLPKEGFGEPPAEEATAPPEPDGNTGLIIDARGLGLSPAMAPKIVDEADKLVYGAKLVSRKAAVTHGIAVYEKDLDTAKKNDRIGSNPLVIKGTKAKGRNKTNVVVSDDDGAKTRIAAEGQAFLNQCKVVVVVD
jgi:hypothetical protein